MKELFIFAGPNGSGKSTATRSFYSVDKHKGIKYVNADNYAIEKFGHIEDYKKRNEAAAIFAETKRQEYLAEGRTFAYETVLSTDRHIKFMQKAHENGYFVSTYYISTQGPEINVSRVAKRVDEGGHDVPTDKIRERYERCMRLMPQVIENSDFFVLFDNTQKYQLVILKHEERYYMVLGNSNIKLDPEMQKFNFQIVTLEDIKNMAPEKLEGFEEFLTTKSKD